MPKVVSITAQPETPAGRWPLPDDFTEDERAEANALLMIVDKRTAVLPTDIHTVVAIVHTQRRIDRLRELERAAFALEDLDAHTRFGREIVASERNRSTLLSGMRVHPGQRGATAAKAVAAQARTASTTPAPDGWSSDDIA